jgi:hypothetical protein
MEEKLDAGPVTTIWNASNSLRAAWISADVAAAAASPGRILMDDEATETPGAGLWASVSWPTNAAAAMETAIVIDTFMTCPCGEWLTCTSIGSTRARAHVQCVRSSTMRR